VFDAKSTTEKLPGKGAFDFLLSKTEK